MRHFSLTPPAPANRACLFAAHGVRSRETRSLLFAIEWLAQNRARVSQRAGNPQLFAGDAIGTKNRNEGHLARSMDLTRRNVVMQDPRRAEGKKKDRSGGASWVLGVSRLVAWPNARNRTAAIPAPPSRITLRAVGCTHPSD